MTTASRRRRVAASLGSVLTTLRSAPADRALVAPTMRRRYRTAVAGGLAAVLVVGASAAAVVDDDAAGARADLTAIGLEVAPDQVAAPTVTVPQSAEWGLEPIDVDVELEKSDVWNLRDAAVAARNAERQALAEAEQQALAEQRAAARQSEQSQRADAGQREQAAEAQAEPAPAAASAGQGGERGALASMLNGYRQQNGLSSLGRDGTLDQVAQTWAQWMASNQTLQHNPSYRSQIGGGWSRSGENIVRHTGGASMSADAITSWMFGWWRGSSVHRANMLGAQYTHVGVGYAMGSGGPYAVLLFGGR